MTELTKRRRAITAGAGGSDLLYNLEHRTVTDGEYIQTGVRPFVAGMSCTILMDINITKSPTATSEAYLYRLLSCSNYSFFSVRKPSQWSTSLRARFNNSNDDDTTGKIGTCAVGRKRIVVTHASGSTSILAICKDQTGTTTEKTIAGSSTYAPNPSELILGSNSTGSGLPPAVINKVQVYSTILDQSAIDAFLS